MYNITLFFIKYGKYANILAQQDDKDGLPLCNVFYDSYVNYSKRKAIQDAQKRIKKQLNATRCHWQIL